MIHPASQDRTVSLNGDRVLLAVGDNRTLLAEGMQLVDGYGELKFSKKKKGGEGTPRAGLRRACRALHS